MSEQDGAADRPFLVDRMLRVWTMKGLKAECELCGRDSWEMVGDGETALLGLLPLVKETGVTSSTKNLRLMVLTCENCGNVKIFSPSKIEEILNDR